MQQTIDHDTGEILEETAIARIEEHAHELGLISQAVDAKAFTDKAAALHYWSQRSQVSSEAMFAATELWLRGERRLGELLPDNHGGDRKSSTYDQDLISRDKLDIDKNLFTRARQLAAVPLPAFERKIAEFRAANQQPTPQAVWKKTREERKEERRADSVVRAAQFEAIPQSDRYQLFCSDIATLDLGTGEVDVIITDPPYPQEYLPIYEELAHLASYTLKPGGSLIVMVGQSYLPEILAMMTPIIRYHWTVAYLTPGGQATQLWQRNVNTFWKPVLWFVNGDYAGSWIGDVSKSAVNDNDKRFHDWGQSESGMMDLIERFSRPNDVILDPFCGGGTTGVAALAAGRRFIGADIDQEAIATTEQRLVEIARNAAESPARA